MGHKSQHDLREKRARRCFKRGKNSVSEFHFAAVKKPGYVLTATGPGRRSESAARGHIPRLPGTPSARKENGHLPAPRVTIEYVASCRGTVLISMDSRGKKNKFICQWGVRLGRGERRTGGTEEIPQATKSWAPPFLNK